ncbi:hypothetical protein LUZ60_010328 [Juncus effusus]|nr:hypothetical protein LUZ60_010328 [Juncus effusus]
MEALLETKQQSERSLKNPAKFLTKSRNSPNTKSVSTPTATKTKPGASPPPTLTGSGSSNTGTSSNPTTLVRRRGGNGLGTGTTISPTEKPKRDTETSDPVPVPVPVLAPIPIQVPVPMLEPVGKKSTRLSNSPSPSSSSSSSLKKKSPSPSPKNPTKKPALSLSKKSPSASSFAFGASSTSGTGTGTGLRRVSSNTVSSFSSGGTSKTGMKRVGSTSGINSVELGSVNSKRNPVSRARDSRTLMLPQVDLKLSDELRLDRRGHRVANLRQLSLSPNLEFVYLRDNRLSSVEGIEVLKRIKVLDLSFNEFKVPAFEPLGNCKNLQQLYLAGNQISSLSTLPVLPNLEFLSVAQNKLKSLAMASQPRLQVLAASKNKISTLRSFPNLPSLEHLRIEENPILDVPHVEAASILLVGPSLKKFNDRDLLASEVEVAKKYPPHTSFCIKNGWLICEPESATESTFLFLTELWKDKMPPGYMVKEASVDQPFEEDACCCNFSFSHSNGENYGLVLRYKWFIGGSRTPSNFTPIDGATDKVYWPKKEDVGKYLKVECTSVLDETEFPPIFTISKPVSPGTGIPKIMDIKVEGELIEGNILKGSTKIAWCGGTPSKGVSSWLRRGRSDPEIIQGAEEDEYKLMLDDIDSYIYYMYTPVTQEGSKGESKHFMTDYVKAAAPSVSNVSIKGEAIEGCTITGTGNYFGGKEGPSKYQWLRENENGDLGLIASGMTEYTLTKEDIGSRIMFVYIPINDYGLQGKSGRAMTDIIKKAPPKVINFKIIGDMREGSKVIATFTITGGTDALSRVQWFKSDSPKLIDENGLEALTTSKTAKTFRIPLAAVGFYLVAKLIPMDHDGEVGEPAYFISETLVETLPPCLNFLNVSGEFSEGELLTASYGYMGGHEGKSQYSWFLHENESSEGELIQDATGDLHYRISKDAIGKYVSFKCTPVRDDGTIGEPIVHFSSSPVQPGSPRLVLLEIEGEAVEGKKLVASKRYWGGEEGDSIFRWFLVDSDEVKTEIEGASGDSYTLTCDDIGSLISVSCEPVRKDGVHGPVVFSERTGPIMPGSPVCSSLALVGKFIEGERLSFNASYTGGFRGNCVQEWYQIISEGKKEKLTNDEFLDLTLDHVGVQIELVFTPVRNDGEKGPSKSIISDVVIPAEPKGVELIVPDCHQDSEIVPAKSYFGGEEGSGKFTWYRTKEKLDEQDSLTDALVVAETLNYKPSLEDVDSYLYLHWIPTRSDGKTGDTLLSTSQNPVMAAAPVVSGVCMKEMKKGVFNGEGIYYGGYEGSSLYSWHRENNEGEIIKIEGADAATYEVTDSDYTFRIFFGYTPVRSDGVFGELVLSEPSDIIFPELPQIETLTLKGKEIEGDTLTAVETVPNTETQRNVWDKYKKEILYQWYYSVGTGEVQSFEPLPNAQNSHRYKLRLDDIGRCIKCECTVSDIFGRSSQPASALTSPILPGVPKIERLEIEGKGFHTNLYSVNGLYTGGKEGKSRIQWLRSMVGSPDLISIPGEVGRMYEANVDDVGYRLVAIYTPVREDGVEGQAVSISTEPISVEPEVHKEVKQKLELGSVKFEVLCDKDRSDRRAPGVANLERRILEANRKRIKVVKPGSKASFAATEIRGSYAPPFHVELYRNDQHRFKIVVDSETDAELMVQTRHMRDVIVLVMRGFAQKFNSTSLNSLLKIES